MEGFLSARTSIYLVRFCVTLTYLGVENQHDNKAKNRVGEHDQIEFPANVCKTCGRRLGPNYDGKEQKGEADAVARPSVVVWPDLRSIDPRSCVYERCIALTTGD
jgi:hypothetical protein